MFAVDGYGSSDGGEKCSTEKLQDVWTRSVCDDGRFTWSGVDVAGAGELRGESASSESGITL